MKTQKNFKYLQKFTQFCKFEGLLKKSEFLEIAAKASEARDFLNIF